jgi:hypothetical protein
MSWRHFLRGGVRSAWLQYVSELHWARLPTGLRCGIAREERERSTARPLPWCVFAWYRAPMTERSFLASPGELWGS